MDQSTTETYGRYLGKLILEPLSDGRLMRLVEPFGFLDSKQTHWPVPVGAKVDGASIPQILWSLIGGPFEGKYRDASVVHDYYCDVRTRPWRAVHQVFYDAMRTSQVSESRAKLMYAAVYYAGPRWTDTAVDNANLPHVGDSSISYRVRHTKFDLGVLNAIDVAGESAHSRIIKGSLTYAGQPTLDLTRLQSLIDENSPSLTEIERAIDNAEVVEPPWDNGRELTMEPGSLASDNP
jgi:hypothetical protein